MLILLVTGMPGSGKEEFLSSARGMGLPFLRMGDIVRNLYEELKISERGLSVGEFASKEREEKGKNIWAKRAIEQMSGEIFLVDGCRSMDEVRAYRELSDNVKIIAVHSPPEIRYNRLIKRARDDAPKNKEEFNARDARELSWGMGETIALADLVLDNSGSLDDFHKASEKLLKRIQ